MCKKWEVWAVIFLKFFSFFSKLSVILWVTLIKPQYACNFFSFFAMWVVSDNHNVTVIYAFLKVTVEYHKLKFRQVNYFFLNLRSTSIPLRHPCPPPPPPNVTSFRWLSFRVNKPQCNAHMMKNNKYKKMCSSDYHTISASWSESLIIATSMTLHHSFGFYV